jgi:O-antigen ligase
VVAAEVGCIYISENVIVNGQIIRGRIYSGWGCYNNIGAMISMSIPFAFYFANRKKRFGSLFLVVGCLLLAAVFFSCSRGSMVGGVAAFAASFIYTYIKAKKNPEIRIATYVILVLSVIFAIIYGDKIIYLFDAVPSISDVDNGSLSFNDSGRFDIYLNGLKVFVDNPIFGQTFYPASFPMYDFSDVEAFSSFFPPRWHNTLVQLLATGGIAALTAYALHRIQTLQVFFRKRNREKTFIGCAVLVLLACSLLDCHLFNIGPTLFYSMALAFGECVVGER